MDYSIIRKYILKLWEEIKKKYPIDYWNQWTKICYFFFGYPFNKIITLYFVSGEGNDEQPFVPANKENMSGYDTNLYLYSVRIHYNNYLRNKQNFVNLKVIHVEHLTLQNKIKKIGQEEFVNHSSISYYTYK